jgi:hypothetical protein
MSHTVRLGEFDDLESANTFGIKDIMNKIEQTLPTGARVSWNFPGYVSIVLSNGTEIAFGESLESNTGYSWNDFDLQGTNTHADSFEDLKDIDLIVAKLWEQTSPLTKENN